MEGKAKRIPKEGCVYFLQPIVHGADLTGEKKKRVMKVYLVEVEMFPAGRCLHSSTSSLDAEQNVAEARLRLVAC